ncbi:MAG: L-serine ammonia-lyase, iron-sulfur-dependent, subunit alpha [Lachnospiraceae bacterium]|nr:L-serine ammonia-lyase, iron-sulfur-dependent, subunit alpha [Lachnospiraceae bacterium]
MYHNAKELLALIGDSGKSIADIVIENEMEISEMSREAIMDELQCRYDIMYKACHDGLETAVISISGLTGGTGKQMWDFIKSGKGIQDLTTQKGIAYALSCSEVNASMGLIVAAPTAGACGILPGTLICVAEKLNSEKEDILKALATAAGVGQIITKNATVSGAEGGCQAECGAAAASTVITKSNLAQTAFGTVMGEGVGAAFVAICLFFFAFSTILSWNMFAKINVIYLFGKKNDKVCTTVYTIIALVFIFVGTLMSNDLVWELTDAFNYLMVIPNAMALFAMTKVVLSSLQEKDKK